MLWQLTAMIHIKCLALFLIHFSKTISIINIYYIELKHLPTDIADIDLHKQSLHAFQTDPQFLFSEPQFCVPFNPLPQGPYVWGNLALRLVAAVVQPWVIIPGSGLSMKPRSKGKDGKHVVPDDVAASLDQ